MILSPLSGEWDVYYVLGKTPSIYPPEPSTWLNNQRTKIGAETTWSKSSSTVYNNFFSTGSCDYRVHPILPANVSHDDRGLDEEQQATP